MPRIYVVIEHMDDADPSTVWIVDLDKCPPERPYTQALTQFSISGTTIAPEISLTYGDEYALKYDAIKADLPALVEGTIELYIDENLSASEDDETDND